MDDPKDRLQSAVGDRYRIAHEIGQGGMARVFLADDHKHHRKVAIKVLLEGLSNNIGVRRFLQEIEVVAGLQHPHLLTLIDSGEVDGLPYFVMPYVEAQSLRALLDREGPLEVERALVIAREIADGLAYAHRNGIIHRDVKPSNILMSGGHAIIADFGIATALQKASTGALTQTGISVGSPTYMSPEHAAADAVDPRTDVYSLGCVLYEMVCGAPPFDGNAGQVLVRKLSGQFTAVRQKSPGVPPAVETAIHKALAPAPQDRFESMDAFARAISGPTRAQRPRRTRSIVLSAAALAIVAIAAGTRYSRVLWATQQLGEIGRLASAGELASAFALADEVQGIIPRDEDLARLRPVFTDYISIVTAPAGAQVFRQRLDAAESDWELLGATPLDSVAMPKFGHDLTYRLKIAADGYRPVEVLPNIFADWAEWRGVLPVDTLRLDPLNGEGSDGLVWVPGWTIPDTLHPGNDSVRLSDYHIGRTEVTNAEYKRFVDAGGYGEPTYWTEPFVKDGRAVTWDAAMTELRDRSGVRGPSTWAGGTYPEGQGDFPVGGLSYYEAAAYARFMGQQLPTADHWGRAALRHDYEAAWIYQPSANLTSTGPRRVAQGIANPFGLHDVAGNVREWCQNPLEDGRVTRGGAWEDAEFLVYHLIPEPEFDRSPMNGVRLMSTPDPDTTIAHLAGRLTRAIPSDYTKANPVGDEEFEIYKRLFDYTATPLDARTDSSGVADLYRWERISFEAGYQGPRMVAYLFLPKDIEPPYQPIIMWHGSGSLAMRSLSLGLDGGSGGSTEDYNIGKFVGFLPMGGRALVLPLYYGTLSRDDSIFSVSGFDAYSTPGERDLGVRWIKDLRRTMDYLETRSDMVPEKTGFYGYSWGGQIAPMALVLEPRIKAAVLNTAGLREFGNPLPELDMVNYLPRVRVPVLMLNGRHDVVFPYEASQLPFYRMLGTPAADKKHLTYPTTHTVPQEDNARETVAWFDKYLGRPASGK